MFSPEEQKAIEAKALEQWHQLQRISKDLDGEDAFWLTHRDPIFSEADLPVLKDLHISPA